MKIKYLFFLSLTLLTSGCVGVNSCTTYSYKDEALKTCLEFQVRHLNLRLKKGGYKLEVIKLDNHSKNSEKKTTANIKKDNKTINGYAHIKNIDKLEEMYKNIYDSCNDLKDLREKITITKEKKRLEERIKKCEKEKNELLIFIEEKKANNE